jgi:Chemoreceptor zinc-binding domain
MDLNEAIKKHTAWKLKFRKAIDDKEMIEVEPISKDNYCELGKWLHSEAKSKFKNLSSFSECVTKHAAFHIEAGKIAEAINAKKYEEAEAMMASDTSYAAASLAVGVAVIRLKKEAGL